MEQPFSYILAKETRQEVAFLSGIIDSQAEPSFGELQKRVNGPSLLLDFSGVGRINSMGIALILRCLKHLTRERSLTVEIRGLNQINGMLCKMSGVFLMAREVQKKDPV
jgi:anti-anti-sigma regulatory factor